MFINDPMPDLPVIIIGAGLSGLHTAHLLHQAGVRFAILEARDRAGGRILTVDAHGQPAENGFDLGASWFWPTMQPAIGRLVADLGLQTFAQFSAGDVVVERFFREGPRRYGSLSQEPLSIRLVGGTSALVRALLARLPKNCVRYGVGVTAMECRRDGVLLTMRDAAGRVETAHARQIVAALPPRILQATIAFNPLQEPATQQRWRHTPTWMAPHAKFIAIYDRPFWREAGFSGTAQSMVGPLMEIHDANTADGQAALLGFFGVGAGDRAATGEDALKQSAVAQLVRLFGAAASQPSATLLKDWAADPLTATGLDTESAGHPASSDGLWVTGDWQHRLILAGSETSPSEPGYLAGAVEAGRLAALQTLNSFRL